MISVLELNDFSKKVFRYLNDNHPKYFKELNAFPSDFGKKYLSLEIDKVNENSVSNLSLITEDNEITIGFHNFHQHFARFEQSEYEIEKAFDLFSGILSEKFIVVNLSLLTAVEVEILIKGKIVEGLNLNPIDFHVTSWTGKYDKVFKNLNFQEDKENNSIY